MTKKLVLIDGSGFIFRAYHALPPLRRSDGIHVGAVYGFCTMLMKHIEQAQYDNSYLAVIFDAARATFRQDIYPDYKAHRPPVPEELIPQFSIIREACEAFKVPSIELEGFEADDLIASYAKTATEQGFSVTIVSSDKDLMQLIGKGVIMLDPIKNKKIAEQEVFEKFGVFPDKVIEVQALAGDSTDNIPGVPGIGIKTAAELINTFGSVESLLERVEEIKQPKRRLSLIENAENARISKKLVTLCDSAPLPADIEVMVPQQPDIVHLKEFMRSQGFNSLVSRVDKQGSSNHKPAPSKATYITIRTADQLKALIQECLAKPYVAFDTETTSLSIMDARIVGISLSHTAGQGYYIPLNHQEATPQLDERIAFELLHPLLTDPAILKIGQNIKYDLGVLHKYGVEIFPITDTMLISYVLDGSRHRHGMDELAERHLQHTTIKYNDVVGTGRHQKTFDMVDIGLATDYAAEDADITLRLYEHLYPRLAQEKMMTVYERIERPLISIIADMELIGVRADQQLLLERNISHVLNLITVFLSSAPDATQYLSSQLLNRLSIYSLNTTHEQYCKTLPKKPMFEKDIFIAKMFMKFPILYSMLDKIAEYDPERLLCFHATIMSLLVNLIGDWNLIIPQFRKVSQERLLMNRTLLMLSILSKGQWIGRPFTFLVDLVPFISAESMVEILTSIFHFVHKHPLQTEQLYNKVRLWSKEDIEIEQEDTNSIKEALRRHAGDVPTALFPLFYTQDQSE